LIIHLSSAAKFLAKNYTHSTKPVIIQEGLLFMNPCGVGLVKIILGRLILKLLFKGLTPQLFAE
jgi:hypothetical protein